MLKCIVFLGYEKVDYVSKKTNNRVEGYRLYFCRDVNDRKGSGSCFVRHGVGYEPFYVSSDFFNHNHIDSFLGLNVVLTFNEYGSLTTVSEI